MPAAAFRAEIAARQGFNYALLDDAETTLLGCVYIDLPEKQGADADITWWVVDGQVGTGLERALVIPTPSRTAAGLRPRRSGLSSKVKGPT